ncbi:recombinase family protein [Phascolarctobacterium faecium]|uniref:recombinase family protein n=1 Tax=Phascolarctobacterium faecium TaxID=33025 RepID=UPI003522AE53
MTTAKNVMVIPARRRLGNTVQAEERPKLRVAAYCRVSTDSDEQATSYEAQVEHYTAFIKQNSEWEFAGIFADDGISGTNTKKREEFNRMIGECMAGNIDLIVTKSISRFARNTLDCLKYIRELKEKNIPVFFEKENINTMDSKGEVLLTIMASLAQQESQSLSQNVKLGLQYRYQNGEVQVNHNRFLGYTKDEDGHLIIEPVEAEVVKRIYREYLEGASLLQICRSLKADSILTAANKPHWRPETVKKILQNEKYIGDALLQKTYTVDFLTKKRVKNNGIVPQYYVENSHEPIIPRELFMQVQEEMVRRANLRGGKDGKKRVYSSKYALSSIVYCGQCGDIYRRVHWNNRGYKSIVWRCVSRLEEKGSECTAPTINEETLQTAVVKTINELLANKEPFLQALQKNVATILNEENDNATNDIDSKLEELQQQLLIQAKSKNDYEDVADEIYRLRELKQNALVENAEREGKRQRIAEINDFLNEQSCQLEEYDEQLVRRLIEKVTVFHDKFAVEFKSGVEIDVEG